jgi:hypothetical protein
MGGPQDHPYFGEMVYFGSKDPGTQAGPEASEEAFCKAVLSDVETLFKRCQTAFEPIFAKWTKQPFPSAWRDGFTLDGFEVPPEGNAGSGTFATSSNPRATTSRHISSKGKYPRSSRWLGCLTSRSIGQVSVRNLIVPRRPAPAQ